MLKSRNPRIDFDQLALYFREPYVIDLPDAVGKVTLTQPTIGDVIKIGEERFYKTLSLFITNTTSYRLILWGDGYMPKIDWCKFSDFELFTALVGEAEYEVYRLFLDVDLRKFERLGKDVDGKQVLTMYSQELGVEISESVYFHISQYLRAVFNSYPEEKITNSLTLKRWYIDKDRREKEIEKQKAEKGEVEKTSSLLPIISAYLNHPGTKYKSQELKELGVFEFWDGVQRLQIYEQATACMKGLYSGMVDGSKVKAESYNFMKEIKREYVVHESESYKKATPKKKNKKK